MDIRALDVADLDSLYDLRTRAFGPLQGRDRDGWFATVEYAIRGGTVLGVYDGHRLAASGRYLPMEQWWHGAAVPMGGVAGVHVAPEDRGKGIGRRLADGLIEMMDGLPLSVLYPATAPVYRAAGYEHAGAEHWITVPADGLRLLAGEPVKVRRAGPPDAADVVAAIRGIHARSRDSGPIDRGEDYVRHVLDDDELFAYLCDDGFLAYHWGRDGTELVVERAVAGSTETARALWAIVGSGSSVAKSVRARVAPYDPVLWLIRDRSADDLRRASWMLRVIDAPTAIGARGFQAGVSVEVPLIVTEDAQRPGNAGAWRLSVHGGQGRLTRTERAGQNSIRLGPRGLAAMYSGVPVATLRRSGLAEGGDREHDALLDAAFAAYPFMLDYF